jgi:hypothetical protein
MIVLSDPHLVDVVLARGNEVEKSVEAIYSRLDIVRTRRLPPCCCPRSCSALVCDPGEAEHGKMMSWRCVRPQINNLARLPTMFSSKHTSAHWKAVRKGVSPAFNQNSIRRAQLWLRTALQDRRRVLARRRAGGRTQSSLPQ